MAGDPGAMHHLPGHATPLLTFAWPVDGWLRGFRLSLREPSGRPLPRTLLHHMNLLHLGRRQLTTPVHERLLAAGQETGPVVFPSSIAIPLKRGDELGVLAAWANDLGADLPEVVLEIRLPYLPSDLVPRPVAVRPVGFDIGYRPGETDAFDLQPGRHEYVRDFLVPVGGRVLAAGGHLHDHAVSLELIDLQNGKVMITLRPGVDAGGRLVSVSRRLFGIRGEGLPLRAGRYRARAVYDNPGVHVLRGAAMAVLAVLFAPDSPQAWPALDSADPELQLDVAGLQALGRAAPGRAPPHGH